MKDDDLEFEDEIYKEPKKASDNSDKTAKKSSRKKSFLIVAILAFVCASSIYVYDTFYGKQIIRNTIQKYSNNILNSNSDSEETEIVEDEKGAPESQYMTFGTDTKSIFKSLDKGFVQCTKDGIKYYTDIKKEKWNDTFTMSSPNMISEENFIAVYEIAGRAVKVYDENGKFYDVSTDAPIVKVALNKNGFLGVLSNDNGTYRIKIFNNQGKAVTERIEPEKNIFPISIDISDDNTTFAISYIDTTDIEAVSKVVFFYVNGSDGEYIDNMFGAVEKQDEYIAYISFMDNDKLVAVTDTSVFAMNITGKEIWSYDLPNKLDRVSLSCKDYIALACGESFNGKDGYSNGTVVFLNMNGNEIGKYESSGTVTHLLATEYGTVVGNSKDFAMVKKSGGVLWEHTATQDIDDIIPMGKNDALYVTKNYVQYADMKKYVPVILNEENKKSDTSNEQKTDETNEEVTTTNTTETVETTEENPSSQQTTEEQAQ